MLGIQVRRRTVIARGRADLRARVGASPAPWARKAAMMPVASRVGTDVPAAPGALVSVTDIRKYIAAIDESAKDLNEDQYTNLVWQDPDELKAAADLASKFGDASGMYADVAVLRERSKGRSAAQLRKEQDFGKYWRGVLGRWNVTKSDAGYPDSMDAHSTGRWYQVRDRHAEINLAYDAYEHLGYKATSPKKAEVVPSLVPGGTLVTGLPWKWIIIGGVVIVAAISFGPTLGLFAAKAAA